ncbi:MAG: hypothetical protein Q7T34_01345 [Candidatus Parcubacteria bacterium]|nr:hypothetical protein [Candidatus Parcubacteria bacterium]
MLIGHQKQWQLLRKSAELGILSHAFLFWGQDQLGKKTLAFEFIKSLNCEANDKKTGEACQICDSCRSLNKGIHPDFRLIEPQGPANSKRNPEKEKSLSVRKEIKIGQAREITVFLNSKPQISHFKTAIINQAHLLNKESQNSLLKTLEEPSGSAILFLITEYPEMLSATLRSRLEGMKFFPVSKQEIEGYLKNGKLEEKEIKEISEICWGRPGRVIDLLNNPEKIRLRDEIIVKLDKLRNTSLSLKFQYAKDLADNPKDVREVLEIWQRQFRNIFLSNLKSDQLKEGYSNEKINKILKLIQKIDFLISTTNVNLRLALEMLMMEL